VIRYVGETKVTIGGEVCWFPPNHGNSEWHLVWTTCPSCEKPPTRYTTNM